MNVIRVVLLILIMSASVVAQDGFVGEHPALAFWKIGQQKQLVIVLHGGPAVQHAYLRPEFDALADVATVVYYDQRGVGKSGQASRYGWQDHVADLHKLVQYFAPKDNVILVGSSWGSTLAMLYTYVHPERINGLILTGVYPWEGKDELYTPYAILTHEKPVIGKLWETRVVRSKGADGRLKLDTLQVGKEIETYRGSPGSETRISCKSAPAAACLTQIKAPVLLFNGTRTQSWDWADHYAKLFPKVEWHTLAGAGHDPWINDPDQFFSIAKAFIRKLK